MRQCTVGCSTIRAIAAPARSMPFSAASKARSLAAATSSTASPIVALASAAMESAASLVSFCALSLQAESANAAAAIGSRMAFFIGGSSFLDPEIIRGANAPGAGLFPCRNGRVQAVARR